MGDKLLLLGTKPLMGRDKGYTLSLRYHVMDEWSHHIYSKGKDQPGKVANPARGQLSRETYYM